MKVDDEASDFPVGCAGAGGLDAHFRLLRNLPADMGVAIVIVDHLRTVASLLHEQPCIHQRGPHVLDGESRRI